MQIIRPKPKNCSTCRYQNEEQESSVCTPCMLYKLKYGTYPNYESVMVPRQGYEGKLITVVVPTYGKE